MNIPKKPDKHILKLLLRAKLMLAHSQQHIYRKSDFDSMLAVLSLDAAVEYILRIIVEHLNLESYSSQSFDISDVFKLAKSIDGIIKKDTNIISNNLSNIRNLRKVRNLVQHGAMSPQSDMEHFFSNIEEFFKKILVNIFDLDINNLDFFVLVNDKIVRKYLKEAKEHIENKEWLKSIIASRNAFENAYFTKTKNSDISLFLYPAILYGKKGDVPTSYSWHAVKDELEATYLGINDFRYKKFRNYLRYIPLEFQSDKLRGSLVLQREWEKEDALFCYNYVSEVVVNWELQGETDIVNISNKKENMNEKMKIGDILMNILDLGCAYIYPERKMMIELLYVDRETKEKIEKLSLKTNYSIERYVGDKDMEKETIRILEVYSFLAVNEPEKWGVIIWYEEIS